MWTEVASGRVGQEVDVILLHPSRLWGEAHPSLAGWRKV